MIGASLRENRLHCLLRKIDIGRHLARFRRRGAGGNVLQNLCSFKVKLRRGVKVMCLVGNLLTVLSNFAV
jgi:hypothetical protein